MKSCFAWVPAVVGLVFTFTAEGRTTTLLSDGWTADGVPVTVPHTWNAEDAADGEGRAPDWATVGYSSGATSYVRKVVSYRRPLPDAREGKRYFIRCTGASTKAEVRVNGRTVGAHAGAFTAFTCEATAAMRPSGNELEIVVDSRVDWDVQPVHADFSVYGGLYRVPELIETDRVCIDPTVDGGDGVVLSADPKTGEVLVKLVVSGGTNETQRFVFPRPQPWSPETPRLYTVEPTVRQGGCADSVRLRFGFRTVEFRADGFYLNGVKRKLSGVCRHQDREGRGWCRSREDEAEDVRWMKEMGADAVRTSHYPQSPAFLDLCDEKGLLVWEEVPNVNGLTFTERARANGLAEAREMVAQHRNHPCVFAWGLFNEIYNKPMTEAPEPRLREIRDLMKALDPSRPVVAASSRPDRTELNAVPDVLGFNLYPGWYGRRADQMDEAIAECFAKNPGRGTIAVSEYGCGGAVIQHADAQYRSRSTASDFHPEEYQAWLHCRNYAAIAADERVWGSFLWVMFDLASDARREGPRFGINDKGLVTWDRSTAKDAYWFYKANWNPDPLLHLVGARMTETTAAKATVTAFSNVGAVKLFVNGRLVGEREPDAVRTAIWEKVPLVPGENTIEVRAGDLSRVAHWRVPRACLEDLLPAPQQAVAGEGFVYADAPGCAEPTVVTGSVAGAPARAADESYALDVTPAGVTITAPTAKGVRYARATLAQLAGLGRGILPVCRIADWPRFPYRGLMTDCGRNYQSPYSLKRILDHLAAYKYNVYHWHLTDEHGWRLESKRHPELQSAAAFARYKDRFYTQAEFLEIFEYAEKLGILVIPELDVPGHTGAFRRAFGIDRMNSPGVDAIVCDLIDELCALVPADRMPFVHLGTDEVRNEKERVPSDWYLKWGNCVTAHGRTLLGWSPGHALDGVKGAYVRDVWGWDRNPTDGTRPYFDSTGLYYINHVDPLELLSAAAYQRPCRFGSDEAMKLGPMIGVWHDDKTQDEHSLARETALGPAVVLFSNSFWRGDNEDRFELYGRLPPWDSPLYARAADLERRALVHRDRLLADSWLGFPFVRQTNLRWRMTDCEDGKILHRKIAQGTVYPWHFRFPNSWFVNRKQGKILLETWIKSAEDRALGAWIGFTAYSRSSGRAAEGGIPSAGCWNRHGSTVELNGERIAAPNWSNADAPAKGIGEVALSDEEYYLRAPTPIRLRKGWNHVRLTVDKHLEKTWKWVATFVPVETVGSTVREAKGLEYASEPPPDESLSASVYAQAPFSPVDLGTLTWRRVCAADEAVERTWMSLATAADYEAFRRDVRAKAVAAMGGFPERTPLEPKVTGVVRRDGYSVEKLYFFSRPGVPVPAALFLPDPAAHKAPYPAIVLLCGHDGVLGKLNPGYQRGAVLAAQAGMATLVVEAIGQGERRIPGFAGTYAHNALGVRELLLGRSMAMVRLWDAMRAVDYLETRGDIDAKRIGAMGNSGGGTMSAYLSAFDPRIAAGAPSCYLSSLRAVMRDDGPQDAEQNVFGALACGCNHLALQLLNDNAILANYSTGDFFPIDGSRATSALAAEFTQRLGRAGRISSLEVPGPHGWKESARTGSVQWMRRWLKGDETALPLDVPALRALDKTFEAKTADMGLAGEEGHVAPHGNAAELPGYRPFFDLQAERLEALESARRAKPCADLRAAVRALSGVPRPEEARLEMTEVAATRLAGGWRRSLVFRKADGSSIPGVLIEPDKAVGVAIFTGDRGRGEFEQLAQRYVEAGKAALSVDLSGFGEAVVPARWYVYGERQAADGVGVMLNLLGEQFVGYRAGELLGVAATMRERYHSAPELHATGAALIPAAHAAFCEPDSFRFLSYDRAPSSWAEVVRHPELHKVYLFSDAVRGALAVYDWCDLLKK